jgi:hypothetical protein
VEIRSKISVQIFPCKRIGEKSIKNDGRVRRISSIGSHYQKDLYNCYFLGLMSSSSHIRRVEISGEPQSFRQTFNVYLLFS